jgi:GNAT superfamily N-acetyltransferase
MSSLTIQSITIRPIQRPMQAADIATLAAIIHDAYVEYEGRLTPPSGAHHETAESLAAKVAQGGGAMAWDGATAVGSVLFEARGQAMYLGRLAVPPAQRRRGIGVRLVSYVEEEALARGLNEITLGVRLQLPENTAFYTKLGYHVVSYGAHPGFLEPTYMTMAKILRP